MGQEENPSFSSIQLLNFHETNCIKEKKSTLKWKNEPPFTPKKAQNNLQPELRRLLLKWMTKICEDLDLNRQTFQLAVTYLDKFCAEKFEKIPLKLIAGGCILIATKQEVIENLM